MDIAKLVAALRHELVQVDAAIASLEQLERGTVRRGRPPAWLSTARRRTRSFENKTRKTAEETDGSDD